MMRCLLSGICHNLFHIWGCKSPIKLVLKQSRKHFDNLELVFNGWEVCGSKNVFGVKSIKFERGVHKSHALVLFLVTRLLTGEAFGCTVRERGDVKISLHLRMVIGLVGGRSVLKGDQS